MKSVIASSKSYCKNQVSENIAGLTFGKHKSGISFDYNQGKRGDVDLRTTKLRGGYSNNAEVERLHMSKQQSQSGMAAVRDTTTRITDSVALYIPGGVKADTVASYTDAQTGMVGFAVASGLATFNEFKQGDYEGAARALIGGFGGILAEGA